MDIPEVPIGHSQNEKPISVKLQNAANEYLQQMYLSVDQLTKAQQQCVYDYLKAKKTLKWWVLVGILNAMVFIFFSFYGMKMLRWAVIETMPESISVVHDDGTEETFELDKDQQEYIATYGQLCVIFGGVMVVIVYSAISAIIGIVGFVLNVRKTKRFFDAFLPAVKASNKSNYKESRELL